MPHLELMAQKVDTLVFADLVQAKAGHERLSQKTQRRLVQSANQIRACQQHARCPLPGSLCDGVAELPDFLVGEALDIVENKQRCS